MGHRHSKMRDNGSVSQDFMFPNHPRELGKGFQKQAPNVQARNLWSPPPYSAQPPPASGISTGGDSPYAFLGQFDTVFVVDDSSSMKGRRWKEAEDALSAIAPICTQYDSDGIDIYFLNHRRASTSDTTGAYNNITTAADVQEIFNSVEPHGATPVGNRLNQILRPYVRRMGRMAVATDDNGELKDKTLFVKPLNIIVVTDGAFTDDAEVVIASVAKKLDMYEAEPWQVGIQFFQIGDDEGARSYLQELDDELGKKTRNEKLRDIVDTVPWKGGGARH
ncbi:hypothetical protein AWENTII_010516 [Aspergillus wentii]